ncbi:hypothetical protein Tco_1203817 [Tanacetum coccineum]
MGVLHEVWAAWTSYSLPPEETSYSLPPEGTGYTLPPEGTSYSLPLEETSYSLPPEGTSYSLPPEETSYSLPPKGTGYTLPPEGTSYSLPPWETSYSLPSEGTSYSLPPEETLLLRILGVNSDCLPQRIRRRPYLIMSLKSSINSSIRVVVSIGGSLDLDQRSFDLNRRFHLIFLMANKDMHTYVSRLKDAELETLIATYDIPLDLRPCLPDPNFRMINLPAEVTAIGIYSRIFYSSGVRIPFSSFLLAVLTYFKVHISQLVPLGLSKVITFEVLCWNLNIEPTVTLFRVFQTLSKQGDWFSFAKRGDPAPVCMEVAKSGLKLWKEKFFLIDRRAIPFHMPWRHPDSCITNRVPTSFNQCHVDQLKAHIVKLRDIQEGEEPHGLDTSILGRVSDRTTSPAPAGTAIPRASLEEITVTRPDRKVVTKADRAAKRKASTGPKISTNAAKMTRSSKKGSGAGSSGQAAGDEVEQADDGTLDDDDQRDGSDFAMEGIKSLNDVNQGISEDASPHVQEAAPAPDAQHLDADASVDEIFSDGNVDLYYEAQVGNTVRDVLERDLLPFVSGPYYIPYPYDEDSGSESPPYTKDDWEEIHGVNLGLRKKELYKDPKVCRIALDRFPTPSETYWLRELSSVELSNRISCAQQTQTIKRQSVDLKQKNESTVRANKEVSRKYRNERDALAIEKAKIEEELVETKSQLEHRGRELSQRVVDFIPDAKKEFDRVVAAFPDTTFPFLDKVSQISQSSFRDITRLEFDKLTSSHQTSYATASLRANTYVRHSTSSSGTFGHTSTPEHLKKKKKFIEKGGPLAA